MNTATLPFTLLVGGVTAAATVIGGSLALRLRSYQGLLFGFSSGALVGVALLDLLPEALDLADTRWTALSIMTATACGFAAYYLLDRFATELFGKRAATAGTLVRAAFPPTAWWTGSASGSPSRCRPARE